MRRLPTGSPIRQPRRMLIRLGAAAVVILPSPARGQASRHFTEGVEARVVPGRPLIHYLLTVSPDDTASMRVRMDVTGAPDTFRIAMAKHPEYDDRYYRYVVDLRANGGTVVREDSAVWRVTSPGGSSSIEYRIQLPPAESPMRAAWRPFLTLSGGLTGGPQAFMYVVGAEDAPAYVHVQAPASWIVRTGLTPTTDPRSFFASNAYTLVESPILLGNLRSSTFEAGGATHTIAYWPLPGARSFDTVTVQAHIRALVAQAIDLFRRPPYREYLFLLQDGAYGALEHHNSVTVGAPSADLARNPDEYLMEIAHEYFHTWNLLRIRPAEYTDVTFRPIRPVPTLWFSEGVTMMYADLLLRRAGLPVRDSSRATHLAALLERYIEQPAYSRFPAERISRVAYNDVPDALGDYITSTHLQGEVLGTMLDLVIRDATDGSRSMDDVMRLMLARFSGPRGFTTADLERVVAEVCGCSVRPFFDAHVRGASALPLDRYLGLVGLRAVVRRDTAMRDGRPIPDFRMRERNPSPDSALRLIVFNPESVWGRAGLHSRDRVLRVNGATPATWPELRQIVSRAAIGDTLTFVVQSPNAPSPRTARVVISGYMRPVVSIEPLPGATPRQRRLRDAWLAGR